MSIEPLATPTTLPLGDIHPNPDQPRKSFGKAEHALLVESISASGVLQPLRVQRTLDRWVLIDGHRRWLAAKDAGLERVPVIVEIRAISNADAMMQSLAANIARDNLTYVEQAEGIREAMRDSGLSAREIAQRVGLSEPTVSKLLAILTLAPDQLQRAREGAIGFVAAYRLATGKGPLVRRGRSARPADAPTFRLPVGKGVVLVVRGVEARVSDIVAGLADLITRLRDADARGVAIPQFVNLET